MLVAERKRKKPKIASSQKYMTDENGQPLVDENGKLTKRYINLISLLLTRPMKTTATAPY